MYTTYMLTRAALKMFLRNRQALFFSIFMPLMIMMIFGSMNFDKESPVKLGLVSSKSSFITPIVRDRLKAVPAIDLSEGSLDDELAQLKSGDRAAVLYIPDDVMAEGTHKVTLYVNEARPIDAAMARAMIERLAHEFTPLPPVSISTAAAPASQGAAPAAFKPPFEIEQKSISARSVRYIEFLLPGIIAMSVMQMSVFSVAFVFAQYREKGVLKRLLATPVNPVQFVTANILTRLTMSLVQAGIFTALGVAIFHVQIAGNLGLLALVILMGSLMFLGLGFTISGLCKTMESVPVLSNIIVFPMLFLGNVFFSAGNMAPWLKPIANNLPLTYFSRALRAVMTDGASLSEVKWDLLGVLAWGTGLITLAMFTFRLQEKEA